MNLDEDAATLKRTVDQNVYERNVFNWFTTSRESRFSLLVNTADEMLNQPGPSRRTIAFTRATESTVLMGHLPARHVAFSVNLNGRETAVLSYVVAHKNQWQYARIGVLGEPPRLCTLELVWIDGHLSFE